MMYHPPTGYIMFSLKKLKFYGGWGPGTGYEDRGLEQG